MRRGLGHDEAHAAHPRIRLVLPGQLCDHIPTSWTTHLLKLDICYLWMMQLLLLLHQSCLVSVTTLASVDTAVIHTVWNQCLLVQLTGTIVGLYGGVAFVI